MDKYDHNAIEEKWQQRWNDQRLDEVDIKWAKNPFYNLMMFPYPSAEGMHVGNMYAFTAADVYGRYKKLQGFNVFEPIGLDGFGIHSENYALKVGRHPMEHAKITEKSFYGQLHRIGAMYDWSKTLETYDPEYYKWTQWIFAQMFKAGLAYRAKAEVNWCSKCKTVLADEQVIDGKCERCGTVVERKDLEQWFFRITKYADRLLANLDKIDWSGIIKTSQRNWIGKREGYKIRFGDIEVFTTRPDTLAGATFIAVASSNRQKSEDKTKWGKFTGKYVTNPLTGKNIPIWEANYVSAEYASGAIMGVPSHDDRDFEFAKKYSLPIKPVIMPEFVQNKLDKDCLENLLEIIKHAKKEGKRIVVGGGWIVDSYWKRRIRNHTDVDMYVPYEDCGYWQEYFLGRGFVNNKHEGMNKDGRYYKSFAFQSPKDEKYLWVDVVGIGIENGEMFDMESGKKEFWKMTEKEAIIRGQIENEMVECLSPAFKIKSIHECRKGNNTIEPGKDYSKYELDLEMLGDKPSDRPGVLFNSGVYDGIRSEDMAAKLVETGVGKQVVTYHLRDWLISRQRYWGPPIPMINCPKCGWQAVPEQELPVVLPDIDDYQPEGNGKGPLAKHPEFYKTTCPKCGGKAERETDVSDTFLDSAWYFLRYPSMGSADSGQAPFEQKITKKWLPVQMYTGGPEHANLHLLYTRFLTMAMHDMGHLDFEEPFVRFFANGMIIKDGAKMSKSKGNVVNPDEYIDKYGADCLRMYLMFMGPVDQGGDFRDSGMEGMWRFMKRVYRMFGLPEGKGENIEAVEQRLIKKTGEDIERRHYNTAISAMMEFANAVNKEGKWSSRQRGTFVKLMAPIAPFLAEELWEKLGHKTSVHLEKWPEYDEKLIKTDREVIVVQVDGKVRDKVPNGPGVEQLALASDKVQKHLKGAKYRAIYVPGKVINFVTIDS